MSDVAIRVENLSKIYRIGGRQASYERFSETLMRALASPIRRLRDLGKPPATEEFIWALKDVSFEVKRGEALGIIGRNGAGKSTLLKILSRITDPTAGRVELHGRVGSLLEVGVGFHPELTGRENIYLNGAILGMKKAEIQSRFDEIVAFAEIEKFLDTPVKHYSSGMYVRLAFAVAAHLEPEILLVDEVLAVGDAQFQRKCLGKMGEVAQEGRTVFFVSHNMGAIASLCTRGILLAEGTIRADEGIAAAVAEYMQGNRETPDSESLIDHPNRPQGTQQLLTRFVMELDHGVAYYGEPLSLRIGYQFREAVAVPQFCIGFQNASGVTVFTLISDYQPNDIPGSLQGEGEILCRIKALPLMPGHYTVGLRLWQPGQKLDEVESVARFRVEWLDRDVNQFKWDSSLGVVYVDAQWQCLSAERAYRG